MGKQQYIQKIITSPLPYEINEEIIDFFKKNYDIKREINKTSFYHIILGIQPNRWLIVLIIKKKKKRIVLYSEDYDLHVVFSKYLNYKKIQKPKQSQKLKAIYEGNDLFTIEQVKKQGNTISLDEVAMMKKALQKILEIYILPGIIFMAFFYKFHFNK